MRMGMARWIRLWPVYRQLTGPDPLGRGKAAECRRSETLAPRTESADRVVSSVCPYCAVGCAQRVYVSGERVIQIEGNQDSPISRGRLGNKLRRTTGIASLGGAVLDNEKTT
jgi:formate dehydrogenase major subunit